MLSRREIIDREFHHLLYLVPYAEQVVRLQEAVQETDLAELADFVGAVDDVRGAIEVRPGEPGPKAVGLDSEPSGDRTGDAAPRDNKGEATKPAGLTSKSQQRVKWLATAMLLVHDHPDWSDAEIARRVGKDKSTLSRSKEYQAAAAMARGVKDDRHRGHISVDPDSGLRDVEAL